MRRNVAGLVVVFVGAAVVQLAISNTYLRYVKPGMRWLLLAAGIILIVLAVIDVLADTRRRPAQPEPVTAPEPTSPDQYADHATDPGNGNGTTPAHALASTGPRTDHPIEPPAVALTGGPAGGATSGSSSPADSHDDHDRHDGHDDGHGHSHHGLPKAAWLLLVPVFALLVVDPPALGADAAQRQSPVAARPADANGSSWLAGSTQGNGPVQLAVRDYAVWAVWEKESMQGRDFQLTGFVTPGDDGSWYVSRIGLTCCVADGTAFMVEARGRQAPPKNQWVTVTGQWAEPTKRSDGDVAALTVADVQNVTAPANPYE